MRPSIVAQSAACACLLSGLATSAHADSFVSLFGVVDVAARAVKNGDGPTFKSLTSDGLNSSRLGFRGTEDLGSGWSTGFWLEATVAPDVGTAGITPVAGVGATGASQGSKFFSRRSTLSLQGPYGEIRLGRDFVPSYWNLSAFHAYGGVGVGNLVNLQGAGGALNGAGALGSNAGTLIRTDNAAHYFLPVGLAGVYGQFTAGAGEGTNTVNGNSRYLGGRLGWAGGPADGAVAFARTQVPGNGDFRVWNAGGSYKVSIVKLLAVYHRARFEPNGLPERQQNLWAVSTNIALGLGEFRAAYQHSTMAGGRPNDAGLRSGDGADETVVGYIYNLSKRTALYADLGRLRNHGLSTLTIAGGTTVGSNLGSVSDRNSTAGALGIRHIF